MADVKGIATDTAELDPAAIDRTLTAATRALLAARTADGHWEGRLSSSALSTATAVFALACAKGTGWAKGTGSFSASFAEVVPVPAVAHGNHGKDTKHESHTSHASHDSHPQPRPEANGGDRHGANDAPSQSPLDDELIRRGLKWLTAAQNADGGWGDTVKSASNLSTTALCWAALSIDAAEPGRAARRKALAWMRQHIDMPPCDAADGNWPDAEVPQLVEAIAARYGRDRTFSVPILSMLAIAGQLGSDGWRHVMPLPFEMALLPHRLLKFMRLSVVSYALPALIAVGQARFHHAPPAWPLRAIRRAANAATLRLLAAIQPESGGFLEAAPLTSFVLMNLCAKGTGSSAGCLADVPVPAAGCEELRGQARLPEKSPEDESVPSVAQRCREFLRRSARPDGSWPIDTNLATWVTTLSLRAINRDSHLLSGPSGASGEAQIIGDCPYLWLVAQQHRRVHPFTRAEPGGWAWTDLSGGVPDADDTAGALLALVRGPAPVSAPEEIGSREWRIGSEDAQTTPHSPPSTPHPPPSTSHSPPSTPVPLGIGWLLDLQNADGGVPTFCRGWGKLPFDRSSPDLTAHAIAAWSAWRPHLPPPLQERCERAISRGLTFLAHTQRPDGSWVPLWFGNQHAPREENPVYGTARVLMSLRPHLAWWHLVCLEREAALATRFLISSQNADGGWGGAPARAGPPKSVVPSSIEETAVAVDALCRVEGVKTIAALAGLPADAIGEAIARGAKWLVEATQHGTRFEPSPIGLYFAKLWYFEDLYPLIFTVGALDQVKARSTPQPPRRTAAGLQGA